MPTKTTRPTKNRCLRATMTKEPFQPIRPYYSITGRSSVTEKLRVEVGASACWAIRGMGLSPGVRSGAFQLHR